MSHYIKCTYNESDYKLPNIRDGGKDTCLAFIGVLNTVTQHESPVLYVSCI